MVLNVLIKKSMGRQRWAAAALALMGNGAMGLNCLATETAGFAVKTNEAPWGISSLKRADRPGLEFVRPGSVLGDVLIRGRTAGEGWRELKSSGRLSTFSLAASNLELAQDFAQAKDRIVWTLTLKNTGESDVDIGDLALSLPMFNNYTKNTEETFERRVFRHAFIAGHGSWVYWQPVGGGGPYLLMSACKGTGLEFFSSGAQDYACGGGDYWVYVHSAASADAEKRGTWRQERTRRALRPGEAKTYAFAFTWADDIHQLREAIRREDGLDVKVAPGMVVPLDLSVNLALGSADRIESMAAEHADQTSVKAAGTKAGYSVYRIGFRKLGENLLTVRRSGGRQTVLEFFVTPPLETVIRKRAAFIAAKQQHKDPSRWYDGLFSLWDVRQPPGRNLLGPDNLGGQHPYAVSGSDDPSNSKGVFLSEKNAAYPNREEIQALEYYLEHFVWGKLQRTDKETPHPYGIYGCDSWQQTRNSPTGLNSGGHGQERMWRTFDYTTAFTLYYNMYRIAKVDPAACRYLDARGYLERAYGTARAFFEVPYNINMQGWDFNGWCDWAYKIGNFHEKYLINIIEALQREGEQDKAEYLRGEWEKKVRFFLCGDRYPWTSEMPVDSTAFESTYAVAKYALGRDLPAVTNLWKDKKTGATYSYPAITREMKEDFLQRQLMANIACRGWLEASYYHLGSDFRALGSTGYCLSYMSQMGGWAILDYGVRFAREPADWIQLGYASMLSSWALVNAGSESSGGGFFYPGKLHDGAAGWGFQPKQVGDEWNPAARPAVRGPWPVDGEIDHGFVAGVEGAATVVTDDPVFGLICYGGTVATDGAAIRVVPRDGIRQRLHVVTRERTIHLALDADGFAKERPILLNGDEITFELERRIPATHTVGIRIEGLPDARLVINGRQIAVREGTGAFSF